MKNIDRSQSRILPLLWAYAEQHLPSLPQTSKFDIDGSFKGHCAGFAETLAEAIRSNQLDATVEILDKLIVWEAKLLAAQPVPQDNQLEELFFNKNNSRKEPLPDGGSQGGVERSELPLHS